MGKAATPRRLDDNEAMAYAKAIRTSPRKLNLVAQMIRGKEAATALTDLAFSRRRIAVEVRKVLQADLLGTVKDVATAVALFFRVRAGTEREGTAR